MVQGGIVLLISGLAAGASWSREVSVTVARAAEEAVVEELLLTADIAPEEQVMVLPKVSGRIQEVRVELGDRVQKGDL
jgi:multidrug efflux pump subunit AcrA (membrane-fusion protein)